MPLLPINLDLLSVGVAVAGIGILGFAVFLSNTKSITNKSFLLFSVITIIWGISNYLDYQFTAPNVILWALRIDLCVSVLHAFLFFQLAYVFPKEKVEFPKWYKSVLIPIAVCIALLTLTPFVFSGITHIAPAGQVTNPDRGPGIVLFALAAVLFVGAGIALFFRKLFKASGIEKAQYLFVVIGTILTFSLILAFDLILPVFFNELRFVPLGAVFLFPFIAFMAYAIFKHHLLSVKIITTEIMAFLLAIVTFSDVIFSTSLPEILFRVGEFILVSIIGIFLIQSVLREVQQREELERLNKQIEEQNAQLQDLSRFKSQLLSLASHQIKSPLAAIKGFASLIGDGSYGEVGAPVKETIGKIQHSADDLIGLINTLLDVRKVEEGKMDYKFERTDLNKMVVGMMELLKPLADVKKLEFSFDSPKNTDGIPRPVWVKADPEKLKQVIQNLTDNAIKYTPSGFVKVSLKETPSTSVAGSSGATSTVTVSVTDSGLGVAADLIPHLFEEFVRDERVKKEIRGTGLGLYIARKIAEAHGGTIWAESEGEGKGSKFNVSLPEIA